MDFRAAADAASDRSIVRDQANATVLSRLRVGVGIYLVVNSLLAGVDAISMPVNLFAILAYRFVLIGAAIALMVVARSRWATARAVPLALLLVVVVTAQAIGFASLRGNAITRAMSIIAVVSTASVLVPWGTRAQLAAVSITIVGALVMILSASDPLDSTVLAGPGMATGIIAAMSIYGAHLLRRSFSASVEYGLDRERTASRLRTSEERHRHQLTQLDGLYRTAPFGLALLDTNLRYLRVNQALADMNGVPLERHLGRTIHEVIPEIADGIEPLLRRTVETGQALIDIEISGTTARYPGVTSYWSVGFWPVRDAAGALTAVSCVVQEISEQRRAQEALRQNEERLRIVSQATNDAVWDWDLVTDDLWCNDGMRTLFGYEANAVGPKATWWYDHIHPDEREQIVSGIHAVIDDGQQHWSAEYRFGRADGSFADVFDRGFVFRNADGKAMRMIGAMMDISERKRAEEALARLNTELEQRVIERTHELAAANAQLSALIENTHDAIWSIDRAYRLTGFNSVVRRLLSDAHGGPLKLGETLEVPEEERDYWRQLYDQALGGERLLFERDYTISGQLHTYLISITPITAGNEVTGATAYARDISALRRAEERVRQHQAELAHVLRVNTLGEMAAGLAHEINQPLGAIANYALGCRRRLASGSVGAVDLLPVIDEIATQALRAGEIIRRLRQLVQKGRTPHEEADLNAIVADAAHVIEPQARQQGVMLNLNLAPGLPRVEVDQIQLAQVILNLMLNGLEAMQATNDPRPELSVRTATTADGGIELMVTDTGIGLTLAVSENMFQPFVTSKPAGLGLGLSISRSIVEEHRGRLWATNNADRGATFHMTIPPARTVPTSSVTTPDRTSSVSHDKIG